MTRWNAALPLLALLFTPIGRAQAPSPAFDVASIKLSAACQNGAGRAGISPRNLALPCVTLRSLIRVAYSDVLLAAGLGPRLVDVTGGPNWLDTDRYDILAKSESSSDQAVGPMLKALLEDRFQVKVHKEAKESPVYILTVAKGGAKLQPSKEGSCVPMDLNDLRQAPPKPREPRPRYCGMGGGQSRNGSLVVEDWYGVTLAELAGRMLPGRVDLPVVDQTGLAGQFDVHLEFAPDYSRLGPVTLNGIAQPGLQAPPADPTGPTIFAALEKQLGLKLAPGKAPLEVIVVDRAEKPSAN